MTGFASHNRLFHMQWNSRNNETELIGVAIEAIRKRLPTGWLLIDRGRERIEPSSRGHFDSVLEIKDPQGCRATIIVETKGGPVEARQVSSLSDNWRRKLSALSQETSKLEDNSSLFVVAPYLGPSARERLAEAGISFADSTGNIRFVINRPAVFIETQGMSKNPWRENTPLRSLRGRGSARVVRGFLDFQPPFGTRELAAKTNSSAASISRVSDLLEREAIISRDSPRGRILSVDWERLVSRWATDYDFLKANAMTPWLAPRGALTLFNQLRDLDLTYAVSGSFAAIRFASVAEPRLVVLYVPNPQEAADKLGLRPADTGGNVLIGRPFDPVVFDRTQSAEGLTYARVTQVLADLIRGPGRGPAEAEGLAEWMRSNEDEWRLPLTQDT